MSSGFQRHQSLIRVLQEKLVTADRQREALTRRVHALESSKGSSHRQFEQMFLQALESVESRSHWPPEVAEIVAALRSARDEYAAVRDRLAGA